MSFLTSFLRTVSGSVSAEVSKQLLFDKVIGFKGISSNVGVSLLVQNVAIALSKRTSFSVCVLDTNFIKSNQYALLGCDSAALDKASDLLDFSGDLAKVTVPSKYSNVHVVGMKNRSVADSLSGKDSEDVIKALIDALKIYFDIVLVDLSSELTNVSVFSAIKCNRIFMVMDTSYSCLSGFQKAVSGFTTLGISPAKCKNVIVMKDLPNLLTGIDSMVEEAGYDVFGAVPMSTSIASLSVGGEPMYKRSSRDKGVGALTALVDSILDSMLEKTMFNAKYLNMYTALGEKERARAEAAPEKSSMLDDSDDFDFDSGSDTDATDDSSGSLEDTEEDAELGGDAE